MQSSIEFTIEESSVSSQQLPENFSPCLGMLNQRVVQPLSEESNSILRKIIQLIIGTYHKMRRIWALYSVERNGLALEGLPPKLRDDELVVRAAIQQHAKAFQFASTRLQNDKEMFLHTVKHSDPLYAGHIFKSSPFIDQENVVDAVFQKYPHALNYASKESKQKKIKENSTHIQYLSSSDPDNHAIVHKAVQFNGLALAHAHELFKDNEEIVLSAIRQHPEAVHHASKRLQNRFTNLQSSDPENFLMDQENLIAQDSCMGDDFLLTHFVP